MGDTPSIPQPIVSGSEPRRWIAAIVGGVLLGEALWAMLQLVIRDWVTPALLNATGQGPTQNPAAFEPLPLVIAFVEACVAAIVLVLLMAWAQKRTRVVTVTSARTVAATPIALSENRTEERRSEPRPVMPAPAPVAAAVAPPTPAVPHVPVSAPPVATRPVAQSSTAVVSAAVTPAASVQTTSAPATGKLATSPAPKKPKVVYYNSVGEPIEE